MVGSIDQGLLVLVAVEPDDTRASADKLVQKLLNYRVFSDAEGKMNLSLADVGGGCCWFRSLPWPPTPKWPAPELFDRCPSGTGRGAF